MRYRPSELIEMRQAGSKGRGVFARKLIRRGRVIERAPVIVMQVREVFGSAPRTTLADYVFSWGRGKVAFACGYGALYNHSYQPNAAYYASSERVQVFVALHNIKAGEEITVNYSGNPKGRARVAFTPV
ncbi:MAG TPA: SET domain-containing protein [Dongiaceae bacterium]